VKRGLPLFLLVICAVHVRAAEPEKPNLPARDKFWLFLLIGQSNMAGRGKVEAEDKVTHPRVLTLTKENTWRLASDPLHFDKGAAGVGLGLTFAKTIAEANPDITVGLIPSAVGGTSLNAWANPQGPLYTNAQARTERARQDGALVGFLWHQGERGPGPEAYPKLFESFVKRLRTELAEGKELPILVGGLSDGIKATPMNAMLAKLPDTVPQCGFVSATGLAGGLHFTAEAYREFGRRYAAAWQAITARKAKTLPGG